MKTTIRLLFALFAILSVSCNRPERVAPFSPERVELTYEAEGGIFFVVDDGNAYRETESGDAWERVMQVFDTDKVKRSCVDERGPFRARIRVETLEDRFAEIQIDAITQVSVA